jgi:hypothetical protein
MMMDLCIRDASNKVMLTANKLFIFIIVGHFIGEKLEQIKQMEMERYLQTNYIIKVFGLMICHTAKEEKFMGITLTIRVILLKDKSKVWESIIGMGSNIIQGIL